MPGLLDRGDMARGTERFVAKMAPSVTTSQVARTMIADVERWLAARPDSAAAPQAKVYEMGAIKQFT
jgi:hypothetical protein